VGDSRTGGRDEGNGRLRDKMKEKLRTWRREIKMKRRRWKEEITEIFKGKKMAK
jgi:hypothetical protein